MKTSIQVRRERRSGFTLVELLVVVAIIAMLAALILPAVNAARENGRRTQCINNQNQIALALLSYESKKGTLPPLQGFLTASPNVGGFGTNAISWAAYLLPEIEETTAWEMIKDIAGGTTPAATRGDVFTHKIPVMRCPSSGIGTDEARISYVVNAGPVNPGAEFGIAALPTKEALAFTVFFDNTVNAGRWSDSPTGSTPCTTRSTSDYISNHGGTGRTIVLSENEDAGNWILAAAAGAPAGSSSTGEAYEYSIGFCYPTDSVQAIGAFAPQWDSTTTPVFINQGRSVSASPVSAAKAARPSSGHPGIVIVAFADRHTRTIKDEVDPRLFQQLCRPNTGALTDMSLLD